MKATSICLVVLFYFGSPASEGSSNFDRHFANQTLRVDYYHTGTKGEETFSLDQVRVEGEWPGSRINLIDTLNLGEYMVRVYDLATNVLIFSRGYSTIFNEWQTTDEALNGIYHTFSESIRLPLPRRPIQLTIARRDKRMVFQQVFSTIINPNDPTHVNKSSIPAPYKVSALAQSGKPADKVDIVILGDGYTKSEMGKFRADAKRLNDALFSTEPFKSRKNDFNVWTVEVESKVSGIDVPDKDLWRGNPLGNRYNTFGSPRYILTEQNKALRDVASAAPYDFICIIVNDTRYGGGGIYNLYATTYTGEQNPTQKWQEEYVYVHEFGHSFGGLGDEYYSSSTGYNEFYPAGVEPWEPNITALTDKKQVKWSSLMTKGIQIPSPWEKAEYDSIAREQSKLDRLAPDYYEKREPLFKAYEDLRKNSRFAGMVGAFEGAGYASTGLYRPAVDCRMFSLSLAGFDPVCTIAIERMIDFYSK